MLLLLHCGLVVLVAPLVRVVDVASLVSAETNDSSKDSEMLGSAEASGGLQSAAMIESRVACALDRGDVAADTADAAA